MNRLAATGAWHSVLISAGSGLSILFGLTALVGWYICSVSLVQLHDSFRPTGFIAALCLVLAGVGAICVTWNWRKTAFLFAGMVAVLGLLAAIESWTGLDLRISSLAGASALERAVGVEGLMTPSTALCFILMGMVLMMDLSAPESKVFAWCSGILSCLVLAFACFVMFWYGTGVLFGFSGDVRSQFDIPTALSLGMLSSGSMTFLRDRKESPDFLSWLGLPALMGLTALAFVFGLWLAVAGHSSIYSNGLYILPQATLSVGLVLTFFLTLSVYALQKARIHAKHLAVANEELRWRIVEQTKTHEKIVRFSAAMEQAAEAVIITDLDGRIEYVNPAFEEITGYTRREALGENPKLLKSGKHDAAFYHEMWETLLRGDVWTGRFINKKKDGTLYDEEASIAPVRDSAGKIFGYVAVKRDVTRQLKLEKGVRQAQKMDALGQMAGGIAHDFNNILASVVGYAQLAMEALPQESELREDLDQVIKAGDRGRELVKQILSFSRGEEEVSARKPQNLQLLIEDSMKLLKPALPSTVVVNFTCPKEVPPVFVEPTQMHQIIMNLCVNAAQAMPEGGTISIAIEKLNLLENESWKFLEPSGYRPKPGQYVILSVEDTGKGIAKDILPRIFEPFFTTKRAGEGTGMGLAVVYGIVKNYGGGIRVYSEEGKGTTFRIYLPVSKTATAQLREGSALMRKGSESVLIVDDEESLARVLEGVLKKIGYRVTIATRSSNALALVERSPLGFDLVILDQTMPEMEGDELAQRMLAIRPDLPIILCSGFSKKLTPQRLREIGIRKLLSKPYVEAELQREVRLILDAAKK